MRPRQIDGSEFGRAFASHVKQKFDLRSDFVLRFGLIKTRPPMKIVIDNETPYTFQTALRMPQELREQIVSAAGRRGFSAFIREAVTEKLQRERRDTAA